jgi:hypothetical protein
MTRLLSSSGCHRRRAVIVAPFPKATSERPNNRWAASLPYSVGLSSPPYPLFLGPPPNALTVAVVGLLSHGHHHVGLHRSEDIYVRSPDP